MTSNKRDQYRQPQQRHPQQRPRPQEQAESSEAEIAAVQAAVQGVASKAQTVSFMGDDYRISERVGLMPLLKFANAADRGLNAEDMAGMAAMYAMIRDCIYKGEPPCGSCEACTAAQPGTPPSAVGCEQFVEGDWDRFERAAIDKQAGPDELFDVVNEVIERVTANPTSARSDSSPAARSASTRSREPSSSPAHPQAAGLVPVSELVRSAG
jgi:hypothetical protein